MNAALLSVSNWLLVSKRPMIMTLWVMWALYGRAACVPRFGVEVHRRKVEQRRQLCDAIDGLHRRVASMVVGVAHGQVEDVALDEFQRFPRGIADDTANRRHQVELIGLDAEPGQVVSLDAFRRR